MWIYIRRFLLTIWFWLIVVLATLLTGIICGFFLLCKVLYYALDVPHLFDASVHDIITMCIENIMAVIIEIAMSGPGFWTFRIYKSTTVITDLDNAPFILAPNHTSIIDTLYIALLKFKKTYSYNVKWSWIPLFGQLCLLADYIRINKNNPNGNHIIEQAVQRLNMGYSLMIYPEGSRAKQEGKVVGKLKTGAFRMAQKSGMPILPIVLRNTSQAVNRYGIVDIANIDMILCNPIYISDVDDINIAIDKYKIELNNHIPSILTQITP